MLSIEDRTEWARAEEKARQMKAHVRMIEYGSYEIPSSEPGKKPYTVKFTKTTTGHWAASCTCRAHVGPDNLTEEQRKRYQPKRCYHIPTGYQAHKIQVGIRQQVRAALEAAQEPVDGPFCSCGADANVWTGSEWLCWTHLQERAAAEDQASAIVETERLYPDLLEPIYQATAQYQAAKSDTYTKAMALYDKACLFG